MAASRLDLQNTQPKTIPPTEFPTILYVMRLGVSVIADAAAVGVPVVRDEYLERRLVARAEPVGGRREFGVGLPDDRSFLLGDSARDCNEAGDRPYYDKSRSLTHQKTFWSSV